MTDPDDLVPLTRLRTLRAGGEAEVTPACLDDDTIASLAEGVLDAAARPPLLAHAVECDRCRTALAMVVRALGDPAVQHEVRAVERRGGNRTRWLALAGVAAAALLALVVRMPRTTIPDSPHRASPITAAPAPQAVSPVGAVAGVRQLRWTPVAGAERYRVTLFDANGTVLYEAEQPGTELTLPDSVVPGPGVRRWWRVEAQLGFDRWAASDLNEFVIAGDPSP